MQPKAHFLTRNLRDIFKARHRHKRDKRLCNRIKAILPLDKGWTYETIAEALLLDDDTIRRYYKTNLEGGKEALLNLNYTRTASRLNQEQLNHLKIYVSKTISSSAEQVANFIKKFFAIRYALSAIVSLLHRLNFEYKKPQWVPGKAKAEDQICFLKKLKVLEMDLCETDEIIYVDGVHSQHRSKPSYGWFKKGVKATLKAHIGRQRINMNGGLNANTLEVTTIVADYINTQSTIRLFQKLEEQYPHAKRVIAICNHASYYRSKLVSNYLKNSRIEIQFLPPYSPNLNLMERLWPFMNTKMRNHQYDEKFIEFKKAIFGFFANISSYQKELKSLLYKKFHIVNS
jgi:transposase